MAPRERIRAAAGDVPETPIIILLVLVHAHASIKIKDFIADGL